MENKPIPCGELPDDPSLIDLITNHGDDKIKRPPNSFMVYAKYNRKDFAKKYPGLSNKDISTLLGKEWKSAPEETKRFYTEKAHRLAMLHSQMHPDYMYSPLEARMNKRAKVRKQKTTFLNAIMDADGANQKNEKHGKKSETAKPQIFVCHQDLPATSSYVPNNPQYILLPTPEMPEDENDERQPPTDYVSENQPTVSNRNGYIAPRQYELEPSVRCLPQHRMQMAPPDLPGNLQFLCQTPSVRSSLNKNNPDSMSYVSYAPAPYYNPMPDGVSSPYYQYWSPQAMSQPLYYQSREDNSMKSFCYVEPPYPSEYYKPSLGSVGNSWPYCRQPDLGCSPHINIDTTRSQESENQIEIQNTEAVNFVRKGRVEETVSSQNYDHEEKQFLRNRMHLEPSYKTTGYKPSFIQRQTKGEMPNCSSHESHLLEIGKNKCETTGKRCAESFTNNNNFVSSNYNGSSEVNVQQQNDLQNFSECELSMPQIISYSSLNEELPRMQCSPHINIDTTRSQESENQIEIQNTEAVNFVLKGRVEETVSSQNYDHEEKQFLRNRMHLEPSYKTTGYKPSFIQRQTKGEMPNCSLHESHLLEIGKNKCETTGKRCAESFANNNNFVSSNYNGSSEVNVQQQNDLQNFSECELSMPQIISYSSLNEELPRMQVLVSQPKQEPAGNFDEVLSTDLGTTETKYYRVQDTLDRNMESNECLNYPANYLIAPNTFYGQANDMVGSNEHSEDTEDSIEVNVTRK